jgi:hypothetical protein
VWHGHEDLLPDTWVERLRRRRIVDALGFPKAVGETAWWAWTPVMREQQLYRIAETFLGEVRVSTAFMWAGTGSGHDFETMVFGGPWHHRQWRHWSRADAWAFHWCLVWQMRGGDCA